MGFEQNEKSKSLLRWPILVLACLMLVGSYYCFDIPSAIKQQIDDYYGDPGNYETMFSLLYTLYATPNVILPFFGGYFVDRFGVRQCLLIFTTLIAVGQVIFAFGISIKSWPVVMLGRLVFGFGGESLSVANSALLADWFRGKELAFAFGINLSVAKLGSVINNLVSPALATSSGVVFACWFGAILCAMSLLCVVVALPIDRYMDNKAEEDLKALQHSDAAIKAGLLVSSAVNDVEGQEEDDEDDVIPETATQLRDVFKFTLIFWVLSVSCIAVYGAVIPFNNISSSLLLERDYFTETPASCVLKIPNQCPSIDNPTVGCPSSQWVQPPLPAGSEADPLVTACGTFTYQLTIADIDCSKSCWADDCTVDYCKGLLAGEKQASVIMSIPYIISAVLSPFLGLAVDKYGFRAVIAAIAPAILVVVHLLLGYSSIGPIGPLVGQGLAYTGFASVLWPAVPLVVDERLIGLAFGVITSLQNLSCAIIPLIVAAIFSDSGDKYIPNVELLFAFLGVVGLVVGLYMNYYDWNNNSVLNRSALADEKARAEEKDAEEEEDARAGSGSKTVASPVYHHPAAADVHFSHSGYSPAPTTAHDHQHSHTGRTLSGTGIMSGSAGVGATNAFAHAHLQHRNVSRDGRKSTDGVIEAHNVIHHKH